MSELLHMRFPSKDRKIAAPLSVSQWMPDTPAKSLLESRLQEEVNILNTLHLNATAKVRTHSNLSKSGKANADGYFTALLQPKAEVTLALLDDSGNQASVPEPSTYSQKIWCAGHGELVQETPNLIWSLTATWSLSETRPGWNLSVQSGSFFLAWSHDLLELNEGVQRIRWLSSFSHQSTFWTTVVGQLGINQCYCSIRGATQFFVSRSLPYSKTGDGSCAWYRSRDPSPVWMMLKAY